MKYKKFLTNYLVISLLFISSPTIFCQFPSFEKHDIAEPDEELLGQTSLVDMDQDGDLDWIVGSSAGTAWWFEYKNADEWIMHVIGEDAMTEAGGASFDVDGDGLIDHVAGQTWYKNNGTSFTRYENKAMISRDNAAADINGDGKKDVVSMSEADGLNWYNCSEKPEKKWPRVKIGDGLHTGITPNAIGDMDGDGDNDIVRGNGWYENVDGTGGKWQPHLGMRFLTGEGQYPFSSRSWLYDMDGDGDNDVIQVECDLPNCRIAWLANKQKGLNWYVYYVDVNTLQDIQSLVVADFDNDGDMDIFAGGGALTKDFHKKCYIWENTDGKGEKWEKHELLADYECYDAVGGDVDGDGDIDICGTSWNESKNFFLKNMLMENK